ncbi:MAG: hypothetical protein GC138_02365 [Gammaproteobacteria bacterium]|nr:hypothetical protein [Gammaproteobacteria bacterium]
MGKSDITWEDEAISLLETLPSFDQPVVKRELEATAEEAGEAKVTTALMEAKRAEYVA